MFQFPDASNEILQEFNPSRLSLARRRRALSKKLLADRLAMSVRNLVSLESGDSAPNPSTINKLAAILDFPREFFFGDDIDEPSTDTASFRSMSKMTAGDRGAALAQGAIGYHLSQWLETQFVLPAPDVPTIDHEPSWDELEDDDIDHLAMAENAAIDVRNHWGLGEIPISNMVHLLESKGVRVFSLAVECREVDAFSHWKAGRPFVFLNTMKSPEHSRFDSAHELGHLVLHRHAEPHGRSAEREADAFASAFLMPRGSLSAHCPTNPSLSNLLAAKRNWKVSVAALNYRLHSVGMLTDWQYRANSMDLAKRGWRTSEPEPCEREKSQALEKMLSMLREDGTTRQDVAKTLGISHGEMEQLLFGLTISLAPNKQSQSAALREWQFQ